MRITGVTIVWTHLMIVSSILEPARGDGMGVWELCCCLLLLTGTRPNKMIICSPFYFFLFRLWVKKAGSMEDIGRLKLLLSPMLMSQYLSHLSCELSLLSLSVCCVVMCCFHCCVVTHPWDRSYGSWPGMVAIQSWLLGTTGSIDSPAQAPLYNYHQYFRLRQSRVQEMGML